MAEEDQAMDARDTTQMNTSRVGDKSTRSGNAGADGSSPRRKSPRKNGAKQVQVDESQILIDGDDEIIAAGQFDR